MEILSSDLRKFIVDESMNLNFLAENINTFNIFEVLNVSHREIRHSNFIGWLIDPNANHGFGDYLLLELINEMPLVEDEIKIELNLSNLNDTKVHREIENGIDIFIVNRELSFTITIENKIHSDDGKGQLSKYYNHIINKFSEIDNHYFVYLTPFGKNPKDKAMQEIYQNISYKDIVAIIGKGLNNYPSLKDEVRIAITQYLENVNQKVLNMDETNKIAQKIYQKHKNVIDYIYANKPNLNSIFDDAKTIVKSDPQLKLITPDDRNFIRFLPNEEDFLKLCYQPLARSWATPYFFAIELHFWEEEVYLKFCFGGLFPENPEDLGNLQLAKTNLFNMMKGTDELKGLTNRSKSTSKYPAVAWKKIMTLDDFWNSDKENLAEVFKIKFSAVVRNLIIPFSLECIEN